MLALEENCGRIVITNGLLLSGRCIGGERPQAIVPL
jgi:hypothetical protein